MRAAILFLLGCCVLAGEPAAAPLTAIVPGRADGWTGGPCSVRAVVEVPAGAPADLGVGAWVADRDGRWFQRLHPRPLAPGRHLIDLRFTGGDAVEPQGHRGAWTSAAAATLRQGGIFLWSAGRVPTVAATVSLRPAVSPAGGAPRLCDLVLPAPGIATGARWELRCRPSPWPENPYDPAQFRLDLEVVQPDGSTLRIPGFSDQPMRHRDRGDAEQVDPDGAPAFAVRFRARQPGVHRLRLVAAWPGREVATALPDLTATGAAWDGFVRVDRTDPRFFSRDGAWHWPLGHNLRSVNDTRCRERLGTALTPDRGLFAYDAYLDRLRAAGGDCIEVWMSAWNLALEWRADWPGYHGQGRYSQVNAWRLDRLLDDAERRGMTINLTLNNHGQLSPKTDREWPNNPYHTSAGGRLDDAEDWFTDAWAAAGQDQVRRYIVARYADSPAILGWKLTSEVNLTAAKGEVSRRWHERSAAWFAANDPYGHPVTTHWSGNYRTPDRVICALPGITYICIDAYQNSRKGGDRSQGIAQLLSESTDDPLVDGPGLGLAQFAKPLLTTEYGGGWNGAPAEQVAAEHAVGPWASLVAGHAGSAMLWWYEWIDQDGGYGPFAAVSAFIQGEDLRGKDARQIALDATGKDAARLWIRAWSRPGRMLIYLADHPWVLDGGKAGEIRDARLRIGTAIAPGKLRLSWWRADAPGGEIAADVIDHAGGALAVPILAFSRHLAAKLERMQ